MSDAYIQLLSSTATLLTEVLRNKEHVLSKCSRKVKQIIENGNKAAINGDYEKAIEYFTKASELDPKYVGARTRIMKAYKQQGKDLEAIGIGAVAIFLSKEPKVRCQVYDLMGQISKDIFLMTRKEQHIEQALSFYQRAFNEDPKDILPRWNYICGAIAGAQKTKDLPKSEYDIYIRSAKAEQRELQSLLRKGTPEVGFYINEIVREAKAKFPSNDMWWDSQLKDLEEILHHRDWRSEVRNNVTQSQNKRKKIRNIIILLVLTSTLLGANYVKDISIMNIIQESANKTNTNHNIQNMDNNESEATTKAFTFEYKLSDDGPKVIERDWGELAEIERNWDDFV